MRMQITDGRELYGRTDTVELLAALPAAQSFSGYRPPTMDRECVSQCAPRLGRHQREVEGCRDGQSRAKHRISFNIPHTLVLSLHRIDRHPVRGD
jgi:hypothetical protein